VDYLAEFDKQLSQPTVCKNLAVSLANKRYNAYQTVWMRQNLPAADKPLLIDNPSERPKRDRKQTEKYLIYRANQEESKTSTNALENEPQKIDSTPISLLIP